VDIDWEPFDPQTNGAAMTSLSAALRKALGSNLLTAAALVADSVFWNTVQQVFDRIDVMTYDFSNSGAPYSWYNSPLYDQDGRVGSLNLAKTWYLAAGIPAAKLSLGLAFYGWQYSGGVLKADPTQGINASRQVWQTGLAPTLTGINYNAIVPLITEQNYTWDPLAVVPYVNDLGTTPPAYWYITYDNPQSLQAKVRYIIAQKLGGWIIWQLDADYMPSHPDHPHPLLDAVQVGSAPTVLSASELGNGTVGRSYSASLSATGAAPLHWVLSSGSLPNGLSLGSVGVISGTPTAAGTFNFIVTVENFAGSSSQSFTMTIAASAN
jgi:GH18 family chitinase